MIQEQWRCPAPIPVERTVDDVTVEVPSTDNGVDEVPRTDRIEQWRCPAPILVEPTVDTTAVEVPSTDDEVDEVHRIDTGVVEVSCTDSCGADR